MPFVEERVAEARELMGDDYWPYGVDANRKTLETFLRHHHAQGLSSRLREGGGAVPPGNAGELQDLTLRRSAKRRL